MMKMDFRIKNFFILALSLETIVLGVSAFNENDLALGIVKGNEAALGQFPHQILFEASSPGGDENCGGTIINSNTILTSAQCIPKGVNRITVTAGTVDMNDTEGQELQGDVEKVEIHPNYNKPEKFDHDLALVKLKGRFEFNNNVRPIEYCDSTPAKGTKCFASGWGTESKNSEMKPSKLKFVEMEYHPGSECGAVDTALCARGSNGGGFCSGDIGGPLTCPDGKGGQCLLGVASYVKDDCGSGDGFDDVFSDVTKSKLFLAKRITIQAATTTASTTTASTTTASTTTASTTTASTTTASTTTASTTTASTTTASTTTATTTATTTPTTATTTATTTPTTATTTATTTPTTATTATTTATTATTTTATTTLSPQERRRRQQERRRRQEERRRNREERNRRRREQDTRRRNQQRENRRRNNNRRERERQDRNARRRQDDNRRLNNARRNRNGRPRRAGPRRPGAIRRPGVQRRPLPQRSRANRRSVAASL